MIVLRYEVEDFRPFFLQAVIHLSRIIIDFDGLTTNTVEYLIVQYCHGCLKRYDIVTRPTAFSFQPIRLHQRGIRAGDQLSWDADKWKNSESCALLFPPPGHDLCFRIVATVLVPKYNALIGIIWQKTESEDSRPELYQWN